MVDGLDSGLGRAFHHHHRQGKPARCHKLADCRRPAGILADKDLDALAAHQILLVIGIEGAALLDDIDMRHRQTVADRLDRPHEIAMLGSVGEGRQLKAPDRQEDAPRLVAQRLRGGLDIGHGFPAIAGTRLPGIAADRQQRHAFRLAGMFGMEGHDRGEGMGRIYDSDDAFLDQIAPQALDATEAAGADRQIGRAGVDGVARQRDNGADIGSLISQVLVKRSSFSRSAEDEDGHGHSFA